MNILLKVLESSHKTHRMDGDDTVYEWWNGDKKVTLYFSVSGFGQESTPSGEYSKLILAKASSPVELISIPDDSDYSVVTLDQFVFAMKWLYDNTNQVLPEFN